ncbi:MAG: hypothetical protein P1U37_06700 [Minwuia sp.]|nr:hypothetical protein [Minwuia sp.]
MKLADWINESGLRRIDVAERIGRTPAVVTRLCEGDALTAANVRAVHDLTGGAVTPNDLFGLHGPVLIARGAEEGAGKGLQVLPLNDAAGMARGPEMPSLIDRVHAALTAAGIPDPTVVQGGGRTGRDGEVVPVLLVLVHDDSVRDRARSGNANTGAEVDATPRMTDGPDPDAEVPGRAPRWFERVLGTAIGSSREDAA